MGIIRDSFVIFKNWADAINLLPEEFQLETYKALVKYGTTGSVPCDISPVAQAMLKSFSVGLENSICRYNASVENGKKGGRPPKEKPNETQENLEKPNETYQNQTEPTLNLNVNDNDNVNDNNSLSINNKKLSINARTCESAEDFSILYNNHFKEFLDYHGFGEQKVVFDEVIKVLSEASVRSHNGNLRFYQMKYPIELLLGDIEKLDSEDIAKIVWQVLNNTDIKDKELYILGALLGRAKEKECDEEKHIAD